MAWVEKVTLKSGEKRFRVAERAPDGRIVKGPLMHSLRDAERLAGKTAIDKEREELELVKKDYPLGDFLEEFPKRLEGEVSPGYITRFLTVLTNFRRYLRSRGRLSKLSDVTKEILLDYRRFRLEEAAKPRRPRGLALPAEGASEITVAQAAQVLSYTHTATLRLVLAGLLVARKVTDDGGLPYYLVTRSSVEAFRKTVRYARGCKKAESSARRRQALEAAEPTRSRCTRNRTINLEISMLCTALSKAVHWGLLDDTPVRSIKGLKLPEHDSRQFRALTDAEFLRFRRACPDWLLPPLMAAAFLGLRAEEVRQLEWPDVDLATGIVRIRDKENLRLKSQGHTGIREFQIPIPKALHTILSALHHRRKAFDDHFVFHNTVGRPFPKGMLRKLLMNVMKACGLPEITQIHALRKTFITHMARREKNVFLLQELARHKDLRTTRRYVSVFEEDKRRAMDGFDIGAVPAEAAPAARRRKRARG